MNIEKIIRVLAGSMVLTSITLATLVDPLWLILGAFVGLNLIQSAFTGLCPAESILERMGIGGGCCSRSIKKKEEKLP